MLLCAAKQLSGCTKLVDMSIRVIHAKMDENGKTDGLIVGDQTGKEIFDEPFYLNDSVYLLICKDKAMATRALSFMIQIARDNAYGYSQGDVARWSGYKAILANGGRVDGASGSFDCATVIISAYIFAGLKIAPQGYTGSMLNQFKATGMFAIYQGAPYTTSEKYARVGCLYLRPKTTERGGHVFMAMSDGSLDADQVSDDVDILSAGGEPVRGRIRVDGIKKWCNVRSGSGLETKIVGRAYLNDEYDVLGVDEGWYRINYKGSVAYIYGDLVSEILEGNV